MTNFFFIIIIIIDIIYASPVPKRKISLEISWHFGFARVTAKDRINFLLLFPVCLSHTNEKEQVSGGRDS